MIKFDQDELKSKEIDEIISKRYTNEKCLFHFIFLTSNTDDYFDFEQKYYKKNISEEEEKKIMYGLLEKKIEKVPNFDLLKISENEMLKLKEYNNFKKIIKSLLKENYPYISFAYGGFDFLHKKYLEYKLEKSSFFAKSNNLNKYLNI